MPLNNFEPKANSKHLKKHFKFELKLLKKRLLKKQTHFTLDVLRALMNINKPTVKEYAFVRAMNNYFVDGDPDNIDEFIRYGSLSEMATFLDILLQLKGEQESDIDFNQWYNAFIVMFAKPRYIDDLLPILGEQVGRGDLATSPYYKMWRYLLDSDTPMESKELFYKSVMVATQPTLTDDDDLALVTPLSEINNDWVQFLKQAGLIGYKDQLTYFLNKFFIPDIYPFVESLDEVAETLAKWERFILNGKLPNGGTLQAGEQADFAWLMVGYAYDCAERQEKQAGNRPLNQRLILGLVFIDRYIKLLTCLD